MQDSFILD
jgi:hypothetical protein